MANEPEPEFKVTDRRRRSDDAPAQDPRPSSQGADRGATTAGTEAPGSSPAGAPSAARRPSAEAEPPRSLVGLFMMLGALGMTALGEAPPEPGAPPAPPDLEQAAELIDLLILLRERTEGRRSPEEDQVLGGLIYDLQLRYVNARRQSG
jgi:hypothetical protein